VREAFEASLDLAAGERAPFLRGRLQHRPELLSAAEDLLAAAGEVDGFLERPLLEGAASQDDPLPEWVGSYRVLRLLGEGGMGRVYLVDRPEQDFLPAAALKVIKAELTSSSALERFHAERRILGALEHPNIARVLDGGLTGAGLPYFVMEHVDGLRIDLFVRDRALPRREVVELFLRVCRAVAFAHQHLVVHCDLKPSNILVTAEGIPKLLDFGVARLLREQPQAGGSALTPQFASPEQLRGQEITTASDVFSLGLLLARLFRAPILQDTTPSSPGSSLKEASSLGPGDLSDLPRDLAAILLKCLQEAPQARYTSIDQLAADLERHLSGHPVSARKQTISYRTRRFLQRNRGPVLAGAALIVAIVAGTITTARQTVVARRERQRAEARAEELRALASSLLLDMDESLRELAGAEPAREQLLVKAYEHLARLGQDLGSQFQLADLHDQIGDILRLRYGVGEGDPQEAFDRFQQALRIREQLLARAPESMQLQERVAQSHWRIARTFGQLGRHQEHLERARQAVSLQEGLLRRYPGRPDLERQLARYLQTLGTAEVDQAELGRAKVCFKRVLALRRAATPGNRAHRSDLGSALRNLALVHLRSGEAREAADLLNEAMAIALDLQRLDPRNLRIQNDLQLTHSRLGRTLSRLGSPEPEVLGHFRASVRLHESLVKANPRNVEIRLRGAEAFRYFGLHLFQRRQYRAARAQLRRSLQILEAWGDHPPSNIHFSLALAEGSRDLAKVEDALVPGCGTSLRQQTLMILEQLSATQRLPPRQHTTLAEVRRECGVAG